MSTVSQGSLPDMTEEVLGNFSAILESMDFAQELELLGKIHTFQYGGEVSQHLFRHIG